MSSPASGGLVLSPLKMILTPYNVVLIVAASPKGVRKFDVQLPSRTRAVSSVVPA